MYQLWYKDIPDMYILDIFGNYLQQDLPSVKTEFLSG